MQDLINKRLANGFSGFKGIRIEESLPVTEGTINELISEMQTYMAKSSSNATGIRNLSLAFKEGFR